MELINYQSVKVSYDGKGERIQSHQMKASYVSSSINGLDIIYKEAFREIAVAIGLKGSMPDP